MSGLTDIDLNTQFIFETSKEARKRGALSLWTIYDHPKDCPNAWIARRFEVGAGLSMATPDIVIGNITMLRKCMMRCGLYCMTRSPTDDMKIVETWM